MASEEKAKAQLVIVTGMLLLYFLFKSNWFLYVGAFVGVAAIAVPALGDLIVKGWFKLAEVLGAINGRILLTVIFFIVLFPVALLARLGKNKNPLGLRKGDTSSAFSERNHLYTAKDMANVW